jgi:hypothetical protein
MCTVSGGQYKSLITQITSWDHAVKTRVAVEVLHCVFVTLAVDGGE